MPELRVEHLTVTIRGPASPVTVVNNVSMAVSAGRAVGLVGESGAGKSMTAYAMMRLFPTEAASITGGRILFDGVDLVGLPEDELRRYRGARIAIVFQEPSAALNPLMPVIEQVMEGIEVHHGRRRARERALEVLRLVGLEEAVVGRYPHMLSGGQRQRVLIAMAVAPGPALLIADEPTSGLDVTIQAQILDLISRLQRDLRMSLLLITHSLGLVAHRTDYIYVMRRGEIVEHGPTLSVFKEPQDPYTRMLVRIARVM